MFNALPDTITQRMPQYPIRYGIQFDTEHGAREYPANETVQIAVNSQFGDLYSISCLSPQSTPDSFEDYIVEYTRDSHGFRNPEPWSEDVDIVFIGDSFTAAEAIEKPFWMGIAPDIDILELGLPGSGTLEQQRLLQAYGLPRSPEIVVLSYFAGNDIADNLLFNQIQDTDMNAFEYNNQGRHPMEYLVTFHLLLYFRDQLFNHAERETDCPYPFITANEVPVAFYDASLQFANTSLNELQADEAYQLTEETIVSIANDVQTKGAEFVLLYVPFKAEVYWDFLGDESRSRLLEHLVASDTFHQDTEVTITSINKTLHNQQNMLQSLADDTGFWFLDMTPKLTQSVGNGIEPYFFSDTHWNQIGHDLASETIKLFLANNNLLDNK